MLKQGEHEIVSIRFVEFHRFHRFHMWVMGGQFSSDQSLAGEGGGGRGGGGQLSSDQSLAGFFCHAVGSIYARVFSSLLV